jgi:hypothetical protein
MSGPRATAGGSHWSLESGPRTPRAKLSVEAESGVCQWSFQGGGAAASAHALSFFFAAAQLSVGALRLLARRQRARSKSPPLSAAPLAHGPTMDVLTKKVKEEPLLFTFLGLTVAALGGGLRSLATGDNRSSQTMMRARVFFQLCTVCTLVGTVYWKAYTGDTSAWALLLPAAAAAAAAACAPRPLLLCRPSLSHTLPYPPPRPHPASHGQEPPRGRRAARVPHRLADIRRAGGVGEQQQERRCPCAQVAAAAAAGCARAWLKEGKN